MKRKIIKIDEEKCTGCGLCVSACHEGAIEMVNGKAKLLRDDYCDGLGDCLPACPVEAISFEEREAEAYDEYAVKQNTASKTQKGRPGSAAPEINRNEEALACGCPGTHSRELGSVADKVKCENKDFSMLRQWPVQIKLVPVNAPYFENADILIASDCSAFACGNFHEKYMKDKVTIIGCPKLDNTDYTEKFKAIFNNNIKSLTVVRMEVPCCSGLANAALKAAELSGKNIKTEVVVLGLDGKKK